MNSIDSNGYSFRANIAGDGIEVGWSDIGFTSNDPDTNIALAYPTGGGASISGDGVVVTLNQNNCISDAFYYNNRIYFRKNGNTKGNAK